MFLAPVLRLVSRRAPAVAWAAHASEVGPFKPQVRCFTHALHVVNVGSRRTTHAAFGIVMQEAKAQLRPILIVTTASSSATLVVVRFLPCGSSGLLMLALGALGHAAGQPWAAA